MNRNIPVVPCPRDEREKPMRVGKLKVCTRLTACSQVRNPISHQLSWNNHREGQLWRVMVRWYGQAERGQVCLPLVPGS